SANPSWQVSLTKAAWRPPLEAALVAAPARRYQCNKGQGDLSTIWLEMPKRRVNGPLAKRRNPAATQKKLLTAARREFASRGLAGHVRGSRKLEAMHSPLVSLVSKILAEGVKAGTFRRGVNPVHLYISIAGLSYFFFSNTPTLSAIFGRDFSSRAAKQARRKHVVDLVMQSLRP